jgi:hypothetical protein
MVRMTPTPKGVTLVGGMGGFEEIILVGPGVTVIAYVPELGL